MHADDPNNGRRSAPATCTRPNDERDHQRSADRRTARPTHACPRDRHGDTVARRISRRAAGQHRTRAPTTHSRRARKQVRTCSPRAPAARSRQRKRHAAREGGPWEVEPCSCTSRGACARAAEEPTARAQYGRLPQPSTPVNTDGSRTVRTVRPNHTAPRRYQCAATACTRTTSFLGGQQATVACH